MHEIFWCCKILLLNKNVIKSGYRMDFLKILHYVACLFFFTYKMLWCYFWHIGRWCIVIPFGKICNRVNPLYKDEIHLWIGRKAPINLTLKYDCDSTIKSNSHNVHQIILPMTVFINLMSYFMQSHISLLPVTVFNECYFMQSHITLLPVIVFN